MLKSEETLWMRARLNPASTVPYWKLKKTFIFYSEAVSPKYLSSLIKITIAEKFVKNWSLCIYWQNRKIRLKKFTAGQSEINKVLGGFFAFVHGFGCVFS